MAFISSGYNPDKPMENRITDIGPQKYDQFYPPVIAEEQGQMALSRNPEARRSGARGRSPATKSTPFGAAAPA